MRVNFNRDIVLLPMTCRLYVDEVGNSDLRGAATDDNVRYLSLTGILTKTSIHDRRFQPELNKLKVSVFGNSDLVLHRREIMRREGQFSVLREPYPKFLFDNGIKKLTATLPYILITVAIDKKQHLEKYNEWHFDPYHYCMRCLIERYVLWLRRNNERGDVVIEPRYRKADKKVKASFRLIYDTGTEHIGQRIVQKYLATHDLQFYPKRANVAAMQLCDLLAHPSYRSMKFEREGLPEPTDFGTDLVKILIDKRYSRNPNTSVIDGWGRKWLP